METKCHYLVICEGSSEVAYVQELNRFLNEEGFRLVFSVVDACGGGFNRIRQICRQNRLKRQTHAFVLVDRDLYCDGECVNARRYAQWKDSLPPFYFQYFNFEDFLLMHYPKSIVEAWKEKVAASHHFERPLPETEYMPFFVSFIKEHKAELQIEEYKKGSLPFVLTRQKLEMLWQNNGTGELPRSDFATFLESALKR